MPISNPTDPKIDTRRLPAQRFIELALRYSMRARLWERWQHPGVFT